RPGKTTRSGGLFPPSGARSSCSNVLKNRRAPPTTMLVLCAAGLVAFSVTTTLKTLGSATAVRGDREQLVRTQEVTVDYDGKSSVLKTPSGGNKDVVEDDWADREDTSEEPTSSASFHHVDPPLLFGEKEAKELLREDEMGRTPAPAGDVDLSGTTSGSWSSFLETLILNTTRQEQLRRVLLDDGVLPHDHEYYITKNPGRERQAQEPHNKHDEMEDDERTTRQKIDFILEDDSYADEQDKLAQNVVENTFLQDEFS
ncbi:unnamed protein product, partial [Amoebophrya sp. A120]